MRSVVKAAKRGNMVAAKIVLDRLAPPRRSRPIQFDLPPIADTAGLIAAFAALTSGVADGTLTPDEAASVATLLEAQRKAIGTHDLSVRIAALENDAPTLSGFIQRHERARTTPTHRLRSAAFDPTPSFRPAEGDRKNRMALRANSRSRSRTLQTPSAIPGESRHL